MSGFRFNFSVSDSDSRKQIELESGGPESNIGDSADWIPAMEVEMVSDNEIHSILSACEKVEYAFGRYHLQALLASSVEEHLLQHQSQQLYAVLSALASHSDLVAGQYEGGLKVWECSVDLCQYLSEGDASLTIAGSRVLELGCGVALPGLLAAKMGASCVHFQDYNREVLQTCTMVNVHLNRIDKSSCTFFFWRLGQLRFIGKRQKSQL